MYRVILGEDFSDNPHRVFPHREAFTRLTTFLSQATTCSTATVRSGTLNETWKLTRIPGISAFSAAPFSPPMIFRTKPRNQVTKHERSQITEGKCHKCSKWIPLETIKDADVKVLFVSVVAIKLLKT